MPFLNIPVKSIPLSMTTIVPTENMNWPVPTDPPPASPVFQPRAYRWRVTMSLPPPLNTPQTHSSAFTRNPGLYNCMDVNVGMWIGDINNGKAWQIIQVVSKTSEEIIAVIQDVYRYNTFKDQTKQGNGGPSSGNYVAFELGPDGLPAIDTDLPLASVFTQNISGRFDYINLQYDYPLYQAGNTFQVNDVIAVDPVSHIFVKADSTFKTAVGRVTSISDTMTGWFTINPVQKIVDFLDYLPGNVGDIIYSSTSTTATVTTTPGGAELYVKLRNNTSSVSDSTGAGPTTPGNKFNLNGVSITVGGSGTTANLISAVNAQSSVTGISATTVLAPTVATTDINNTKYGQVAQFIGSPNAQATINGTLVTFNIASAGDPTLAFPPELAQSINAANIPNIIASSVSGDTLLRITNTAGGAITIVNVQPDSDGMNFAGSNSGSGLPLFTPASTQSSVRFTAVDARPIEFINTVGDPVGNFGLISVENGVKACGLYIQSGLRQSSSNVVNNIAALNALNPIIGDQAYVINSDDGNGNYINQWSTWLYNGTAWVLTGRQSSSTVAAKTITYALTNTSPSSFNIGTIVSGTRVTVITVEVTTAFGSSALLELGYSVANPTNPQSNTSGLMSSQLIDLTKTGVYATTSDILFGTDTATGDVTLTGSFISGGSTTGSAQILISYV